MSTDSNQWVEVIARLTALTQEGNLKWEARPPYDERSVLGLSYYATHKDRRLRLEKRAITEEDPTSWRRQVRVERVFLEFVDDSGNSLWAFPYIDALDDLYSAVRFQTADVKAFLDDLLSAG